MASQCDRFTIRAPSFGLSTTVDIVRCILRDGSTSFDFMRAARDFAIDVGTLSQSSRHFYTSNYNFQAWFSLVKLQNVILKVSNFKEESIGQSNISDWSTLIPRNSLAGCAILEVVVDPKVEK